VYTEIGCVLFGSFFFLLATFIGEIPLVKRLLMDRQGWKGWIFRTIRDIVSAYLAVIIWKGTYNIFGFLLSSHSLRYLFVGLFFFSIHE
jgi:hypothetical protein